MKRVVVNTFYIFLTASAFASFALGFRSSLRADEPVDYKEADAAILASRAHYLASNGSFKDFEDFLKKYPSVVDSSDESGDHLAMSAAMHSASDNFELVIQLRPQLKTKKNRRYYAPFHYAIMFGSIEVLRFLLDRESIDLNTSDREIHNAYGNGRPTYLAARNLQIDVLKFLVERGAKVRTSEDRRPEVVVKFFIESSHKPNLARKAKAQEIYDYIQTFPYIPHSNPARRADLTNLLVEKIKAEGFSRDAKELITQDGASLTDLVVMKFDGGYFTVKANVLGLIAYYGTPDQFKDALKLNETVHEDLDVAIRALHFFARITPRKAENMIQNYITLRKAGACGPEQGLDYLDFQDGRRTFEKNEIEGK